MVDYATRSGSAQQTHEEPREHPLCRQFDEMLEMGTADIRPLSLKSHSGSDFEHCSLWPTQPTRVTRKSPVTSRSDALWNSPRAYVKTLKSPSGPRARSTERSRLFPL